jgi:hypothetical protein
MTNSTCPAGKGPHRDPDKQTFWRKTLKEQAGSGRSVRGFCADRGLSEPSFYSWRRAIAQRGGQTLTSRSAAKPKRPTFVELRPQQPVIQPAPEPHTADAPLVLVAGDRRLLIRPGCDRVLLREVLAALGE